MHLRHPVQAGPSTAWVYLLFFGGICILALKKMILGGWEKKNASEKKGLSI